MSKKPTTKRKAKAANARKPAKVTLTPAQIAKRAKPYNGSQLAFRKGDRDAYNAARRAGILDDVCKARHYRRWGGMSDKQLTSAGIQFKSRADLRTGDSGLYQALRKRDLWAAVCKRAGW